MTRIRPFQAIKPDLDIITSSDVFFGEVKKNYPEFQKGGFFNRLPSEGVYIYRLITKRGVKLGLVACIPVDDYKEGKIIKHEHTLAPKEQKMMLLTLERKAMVKPILLTHPPVKKIEALMEEEVANASPVYTVAFDAGDVHQLYAVTDGKSIKRFQELYEAHVPKTYVADGHHRLATSANLCEQRIKKGKRTGSYGYMLCSLFSTSQLEIHDYNRIVEFDRFSPMVLMALLSRKFNITLLEEPRRPEGKHEVIMVRDEEWFSMKWRPEILKKYKTTVDRLDVNLLNEEVLANVFSVEDIKTDRRVKYIEGPRGIEGVRERLEAFPNRVAFILPPVTWEEFLEITDSGMTLPPKSTWFEPRMKNGLIVYGF